MPLDHVLQGRERERSHEPGEARDVLRLHRVAFLGHRRTPDLVRLVERLGDLGDLCPLEVGTSVASRSEVPATRARKLVSSAIRSANDLGRRFVRLEAESLHDAVSTA